MRILAIGSKGHDRAECLDWLQPLPNIEEFDAVIINLQSLTQVTYDKCVGKIRALQAPISTILNTGREVFCILNTSISPSPVPISGNEIPIFSPARLHKQEVYPNNYDWLPTKIRIDNRLTGQSISLSDERFRRYFDNVDRWEYEISIIESYDVVSETVRQVGSAIGIKNRIKKYALLSIATNKSQKIIGGVLVIQTVNGRELTITEDSGAIYLLPPTTKCDIDVGIEILLDGIYGEEHETAPSWRNEINIPEITRFEQQIGTKEKEIESIQIGVFEIRKKIKELDAYRDLFTETGQRLERIVQRTLADIGIRTKNTEIGFPADLVNEEFAIEVTGVKGSIGVSSEKVNQSGRFGESYSKGEKMILIANTHMNLRPKEREGKMDFSKEVEKWFNGLSVGCLTTKTLFEVWMDVRNGELRSEDVKNRLLTKSGVLSIDAFHS